MITFIEITNIQSHKFTRLDLGPGFNVMSGTTGSGKSSVIRGLEQMVNNDPLGDEYLSDWADPKKDIMSFKVGLSDGHTIERRRVKGKNQYIIDDNYDEPYESFGRDVPEDVKRVLNLAAYSIQQQHAAYFLLTKGPQEVAKMLNDIVGLSVIDETNAVARNIIRTTKIDKDKAKETIKELEEELLAYEGIDDALETIDQILILVEEDSQLEWEIAELSRLIVEAKRIEESLASLVLVDEEELAAIGELIATWQNDQKDVNTLDSLIIDGHEYSGNVAMCEAALSSLKKECKNLLAEHKVCPFCGVPIETDKIDQHVAEFLGL